MVWFTQNDQCPIPNDQSSRNSTGHLTLAIGHFSCPVALASPPPPRYHPPVFCDGSRTGHAGRKGPAPCDFLTAVGVVYQCRTQGCGADDGTVVALDQFRKRVPRRPIERARREGHPFARDCCSGCPWRAVRHWRSGQEASPDPTLAPESPRPPTISSRCRRRRCPHVHGRSVSASSLWG